MQTAHPSPIVTVDVVVLSLREGRLHALVVNRTGPVEADKAALPGGFVHPQEDASASASARRVLANKTGLQASHWEQLGTFSGADRDPRGWSLSVAYLAIVSAQVEPRQGRWVPVDELPSLAFDHAQIVSEAIRRVRNKASYSSLPAFFLPSVFTLPQLQQVYEQVFGEPLNTAAFRRKVLDLEMVAEVNEPSSGPLGRGRPAQAYRLAESGLQDLGRVVLSTDRRRRAGP